MIKLHFTIMRAPCLLFYLHLSKIISSFLSYEAHQIINGYLGVDLGQRLALMSLFSLMVQIM